MPNQKNDTIILNKYEMREYTNKEEEKAVINMLEDLNFQFQETEASKKSIKQSQLAISNILQDSLELNDYIKKESGKMEAILKNMSDGLYVLDLNEKIVLFNSSAEKMFGWSQSEVIGKKDSQVFQKVRFANLSEPDPHGLPLLIHDAWKRGKNINLSYLVLPSKDEAEVIASVSAAPIFNEKGEVVHGVITIRNMRHEFEIDRAKTEFVSVASHQLRTPLAAIKWFVELLLAGDAGPTNENQKDFLTQVSESTERMIDLVNSLLNVSRIETGKITIEPEPTNLIELFKKAIREMDQIFKKRKQIFKFTEPKKDLPKINIDPHLITEVLLNLLSNASKYTPDGGSVSLGIDIAGEEVLVRVADSGYGIPAHQRHRIFEKFFRAENIMKHSTEGTGLGLYIVKAIIESSGGRIWFETEEDKGTIFYFALPLAGSPQKKGKASIELTKRFI